ncbi:MAG: two-component system sensor histidine kinase NtrB [Geminicoccaceae bacterium]
MTARKELAAATPADLRDSDALLSMVIETAPEGVIIADASGIIRSFSPAAEKLFGYKKAEVVGENLSILMPPIHAKRHDEFIQRYLRTGEKHVIGIGREVMAMRKDGVIFPVELAIGEVKARGHHLFTGFIRDLTAQRRIEKRIAELRDELIHVARFSAMGELASSLAHELNQPLTAIANYARGAKRMCPKGGTASAEGALALMDKMADQARRAGEVIRRMRLFVKHRGVERSWQDPHVIVEEAMQIASIGASTRGIKLELRSESRLQKVFVDRIQIQQVVTNLVRNAVDALIDWKGPKTIEVVLARNDPGHIRVLIHDSGPGIAPEIAEELFVPFKTTKEDGVGIGLAVSRRIIEAHGGRIWGETLETGGASFAFILPIDGAGAPS